MSARLQLEGQPTLRSGAARLRFTVRSVAVAVLIATAVACGESITSPTSVLSPPAPPVAPGTWVFLGSSTTAGFTTSSPSLTWVARLQAVLAGRGITIVNIARPGAVTYSWMSSSAPIPFGRPLPSPPNNIDTAMAQRPRLVLLNATTNDVAAGYTVDETVTNLLAIGAVAGLGGARVVMLSTQPRDLPAAGRSQLPVIDARLASVFGDCFVDIRTPLADPDGRLLPIYDSGDGIHPNDAGHAVIFQRVDAALQSGRCVAAPH